MAQEGWAREDSHMQTVIRTESCNLTTTNRTPASFTFAGEAALLWSGFIVIFLVALLLSSAPAFAMLIIPVSEDDMVRHATAIVVGQVRAIESYWDNQAGQIFTHITVTPQEVLKGEVAEEAFTVKQLGGTVGKMRSWVNGSPEFSVGERVLLFLDTNPDGSAGVAYFYQGKFSLFTDSDTGKEFAFRGGAPEGVRLLSGTRDARAQAVPAMNEFYEVTALKARIRDVLGPAPREQRASSAPVSTLQVPPESAMQTLDGFTLLGFPQIRWFEPDSGLP